jgi:hypothetical protein
MVKRDQGQFQHPTREPQQFSKPTHRPTGFPSAQSDREIVERTAKSQEGRGGSVGEGTCHKTNGSSSPGTGSGSGRGRRSRRRPPAARPTPRRRSSSLSLPVSFRSLSLCPPPGRNALGVALPALFCVPHVKSSATCRLGCFARPLGEVLSVVGYDARTTPTLSNPSTA